MESATARKAASAQIAVHDDTIRGKLDRARMELLDLSSRNRLISTPRRSKTAATIEVVDELSCEIFRLLVGEGRALTFVPGGVGRTGNAAEDDEAEGVVALAQPDDDELDERGVARRHADTKLNTLLTSEALQKRLLTLYFDARTFQEEQGVNILFLAVGFLKWFESPTSEVERYAPLILVPVALERGTAGERFKLRWTQDDPAPNLSLIALLKREHGILLPEFGEGDAEETLDPGAYFEKVATAVAGKPRWGVLENDAVDSNFGAAREEIVTIVSRLLGFKATSAQLRATIDGEIDTLVAGGLLSASPDGILARPAAARA